MPWIYQSAKGISALIPNRKTKKQVAQETGLTMPTIYKLYKGYKVGPKVLHVMANYLNVDIYKLVEINERCKKK